MNDAATGAQLLREERRATLAARRTFWCLALTAALWCAVIAGHLIHERLVEADRALAEGLEAQHSMLGRLLHEAARAAAVDLRAPARVVAVATLPDEAARAAQALGLAAEPWAGPWTERGAAQTADSAALVQAWERLGAALAALHRAMSAATGLRDAVERFESLAARLLADSSRLSEVLGAAEAEGEQVHAVARQVLLVQRLGASAQRLDAGGPGLLTAADRLGRDTLVFGEVNNALLNGSPALGIRRVADLDARALLERIGRQWRDGSETVGRMVGLTAEAAELAEALTGLDAAGAKVVGALEALELAQETAAAARDLTPASLRLAALVALLALLIAALLAARNAARLDRVGTARARAEDARVGREARTAEALDDLADVLRAWARGVVQARLRDPEALPEPLAQALEAAGAGLGPALAELRGSMLELDGLAESARGLASRVARASGDQSERVDALARMAREMADSLEPLADLCDEVRDRGRAVEPAVKAASGVVRDAVGGVGEAQAAVDETARRVGRALDEVRVLRDLVELLDELGDQAKLLSVNVAIQASMDSESGRALANFADEVQRVAERARQGMRRIASTEETLRRVVGEAHEAVKRSAWSVSTSADRAREALPSLETLERSAAEASSIGGAIDEAARLHTLKVTEVVRRLKVVQSLATEVRDGAMACADTSVRVTGAAQRGAAAAARLDNVPRAPADVVELAAAAGPAADEALADAGERAGNVHPLR
jgi:twitching motility protein PilJ